MKTLYKQLVKLISDELKRKPTYVAHCLRGRYKPLRSEIPIFIQAFALHGYSVSERDFLYGVRLSNHPLLKLFRSMHTRSKHDKSNKCTTKRIKIKPLNNTISIDF